MSRESIALYQQQRARSLCVSLLAQLRLEIAAGPRRVIDALVESFEFALEQAGDNLMTQALKREYIECLQKLQARERGEEAKRRRAEMKAISCTVRGVS